MASLQDSFYWVDAFTTNSNSPFTGNPAAVCFLDADEDLSDEIKQKIANEANLSNTAFVSLSWSKTTKDEEGKDAENINSVLPKSGEIHKRTIRWFTPQAEVELCGHATLGSAKALIDILFEQQPELKQQEEIKIEFDSRFRGPLGAIYDSKSGRITLNFPSSPCFPLFADGEKWLEDVIEATVCPELTSDSIKEVQYSSSAKIILLRLGDHLNEDDVRRINPNFQKMKSIENCQDMFGVLVTVKGKSPDVEKGSPHFFSRFFAPWFACVNEDPVCGSAHTVLTFYWSKEFFSGFGETLLARQHSLRGGLLYCTLVDNGERVTIGGEAKIIIKGKLVYNQPQLQPELLN